MEPQRIGVVWETDERPLDDDEVRRIAAGALAYGGRAGVDLDIVFVTDPALRDLHGTWLGDPSDTDVITFDLAGGGAGPVGELYVSIDCASRIAPTRPVPLERELALYVVHGVLHLCGHDDHDDLERERMRRAEAAVLRALGYPDDPEATW